MNDREILEAARIGLELQLDRINTAMSAIRSRLGIRGPRRAVVTTDVMQPAPKKRTMSAAARKRIGEATRKRWEAFRKGKAEAQKAAEKPKPKRKISAEGRARIVAATKKRWAAVHKAQRAVAKKRAPVAKNAAPKKTMKAPMKPEPPSLASTPETT